MEYLFHYDFTENHQCTSTFLQQLILRTLPIRYFTRNPMLCYASHVGKTGNHDVTENQIYHLNHLQKLWASFSAGHWNIIEKLENLQVKVAFIMYNTGFLAWTYLEPILHNHHSTTATSKNLIFYTFQLLINFQSTTHFTFLITIHYVLFQFQKLMYHISAYGFQI